MRKWGWEQKETRFAKMVQKKPQSLCQVHAQQSNADDIERSFLQTCHDAVKPIAALANPKFALDNVSVVDILILLFLCLPRSLPVVSGQVRSAGCPAPCTRKWLPVPVDFVNKNSLRIAAMLLTVVLYGAEKSVASL